MKNRESIHTTAKEIVSYWRMTKPDGCITVNWSEAETHCWRCGTECKLQRCHIIPDSLGGIDEPSNFVLLCSQCHADGPNVADSEIMWEWLEAYKMPTLDMFWDYKGHLEYEFIYRRSYYDDLYSLRKSAEEADTGFPSEQKIKEFMWDAVSNVSVHWGQSHLNPATTAACMRLVIKRIANEYGLQMP